VSDEDDLAQLRHHWDGAYSIMHGRDGWQAKRRDGQGGWIVRATAEQLLAAIHEDYARHPVPRGSDDA
jgi:hypothetical protein